MLEAIELMPARRRAPRHACALEVPLICDLWDAPVNFTTRDVSVDGVYFDTPLTLDPGTEVVLEISDGNDEPHFVLGRVRRVGLGAGGMGVELLDCEPALLRSLEKLIMRCPPAIPRSATPIEKDWAWVDTLLTYEEHLGDRINIIEVSEFIGIAGVEHAIDCAFSHASLLS